MTAFRQLKRRMESTALELVNKLDGAVDLLVSDIKMPVMDGITLAWSVRSEFPSIPVILVPATLMSHKRNSQIPASSSFRFRFIRPHF
jgi:CheY-like chemotaxis protein